jgi:type I restriction enzyme S subunit
MPQPGDVVVTTEAPLGEVAQLGPERVALAQRLVGLRGKPEIVDNRFLLYLLQTRAVQEQLRSRATGTTVLGIKQSELRKVSLTLPPLPEQRAIASILGALDDKIELNRRMSRTLDEMAHAIFKSWFVDFEGQGSIDQTTQLPVGWKLVPFSSTVRILAGGTPRTSVDEYWDGDIPWFAIADAPDESAVFVLETAKKTTPEGVRNSSTQVLPLGTTILTARGTVGLRVMVGTPMAMNQSCFGLCGLHDSTGYYTYRAVGVLVDELKRMAHGSVFSTINRATLDSIGTSLPPSRLIAKYEAAASPMMERIRLCGIENGVLRALRDTLSPQLLSGALRA